MLSFSSLFLRPLPWIARDPALEATWRSCSQLVEQKQATERRRTKNRQRWETAKDSPCRQSNIAARVDRLQVRSEKRDKKEKKKKDGGVELLTDRGVLKAEECRERSHTKEYDPLRRHAGQRASAPLVGLGQNPGHSKSREGGNDEKKEREKMGRIFFSSFASLLLTRALLSLFGIFGFSLFLFFFSL